MDEAIALALISCFKRGNKLLIFGCGGSNAQASHLAAEFIGIGLPAIALNDPAVITALLNDFAPSQVFALYLAALVKRGDIALALSTSGKSDSVLKAITLASKMRIDVIDFPRLGKTTAQIQENQLVLIHKIFQRIKNENI